MPGFEAAFLDGNIVRMAEILLEGIQWMNTFDSQFPYIEIMQGETVLGLPVSKTTHVCYTLTPGQDFVYPWNRVEYNLHHKYHGILSSLESNLLKFDKSCHTDKTTPLLTINQQFTRVHNEFDIYKANGGPTVIGWSLKRFNHSTHMQIMETGTTGVLF
jgi:hypothetical protein